MKKIKSIRQRQRQKASRKTIIIIGVASITCMIIGLTVFFNLSHVDQINATGIDARLVTDQEFTIEKSLPVPVIVQHPVINSKTIFIRQVKPLPPSQGSATR